MADEASGPWRLLDPATATRPGEELRPTAYHALRLRVAWRGDDELQRITRVLNQLVAEDGHVFEEIPLFERAVDEPDQSPQQGPYKGDARRAADVGLGSFLEQLPDAVAEIVAPLAQSTLELRPTEDDPGPPPDPAVVLRRFRATVDDVLASRVDLDHVVSPAELTAAPYWASPYWASPYWASPYWASPYWASPYWASTPGGGAAPAADYTRPGFGARTPVHLEVADPRASAVREVDGVASRRPVVAVVDSGLGHHPWFVDRLDPVVTVGGTDLRIGGDDVDLDPTPPDPLHGTLSPTQGHGTFVTGLVRQAAPYADVLPVAVVGRDGMASETATYAATLLLLTRHLLATEGGDEEQCVSGAIDVVTMSLGLYHQDAAHEAVVLEGPSLLPLLVALVDAGVAVVTAAGNDATDRRFFPAGYADRPEVAVDGTSMLLAVGALNPSDGSTAMFSNVGDWVGHHRCGAAVVSTLPTDMRGALEPFARTTGRDGVVRATLDVDDFGCGFAVWSGTSFAAPIVAGAVADAIAAHTDAQVSRQGHRERAVKAVAQVGAQP